MAEDRATGTNQRRENRTAMLARSGPVQDLASLSRTTTRAQRCWLAPVTVRTPVSVAPIEAVGTIAPEPRSVIAIAGGHEHSNDWRWSIEDRSRRWWRVIVRRPGSAV